MSANRFSKPATNQHRKQPGKTCQHIDWPQSVEHSSQSSLDMSQKSVAHERLAVKFCDITTAQHD